MAPKPRQPFDPKAFLAHVGDGRSIGRYRKGQIVFSQGEPADAVFFIQRDIRGDGGLLVLAVVQVQQRVICLPEMYMRSIHQLRVVGVHFRRQPGLGPDKVELTQHIMPYGQ